MLTLVEGLPYTFWYICYQKTTQDVVPSSRNSLFSGENKHVKKTLKILRRNKQKVDEKRRVWLNAAGRMVQ